MKKPERKTKLEELVDELAEEGLPKHLRIAYYLYDLSRDMVRFANEVRDAGRWTPTSWPAWCAGPWRPLWRPMRRRRWGCGRSWPTPTA